MLQNVKTVINITKTLYQETVLLLEIKISTVILHRHDKSIRFPQFSSLEHFQSFN